MTQITAEHLQHMARRHRATIKKLDSIKEKIALYRQKSFGLLETGFGSWAGGLLEGRTGGAALGPIPLNLGIGVVLATVGAFASTAHAAAGAADRARRDKTAISDEVLSQIVAVTPDIGEHLSNLGNGFIGSYLAATGYAFGKRWRETGKVLGGGGHPWTQPYENGWPKADQTERNRNPFNEPYWRAAPIAPPTSGWHD